MSVEAMAVVLHHSRARGTAKLVLLGIANHSGDGGAYPAVATLARYANVDPRNVTKALGTLQSLGEVRVFQQAGGEADWDHYLRPNRYVVLVACPPTCDRSMNHRDTRQTRQTTLVTDPLTKSSPPDESVTSRPDESVTLTSHITPVNKVSASTTDRARGLCGVCGKEEWDCRRRSNVNEHTYEPKRKRP